MGVQGHLGATVRGRPLSSTAAPEALAGYERPSGRRYNAVGAGGVPAVDRKPQRLINVKATAATLRHMIHSRLCKLAGGHIRGSERRVQSGGRQSFEEP
jgi:hypothetical protein